MELQKTASVTPAEAGKPFSDFYHHDSDRHFWMLAFASSLRIPDRIMACYIFKNLASSGSLDATDVFFKSGRCSIMEMVYAQHYSELPETLALIEQSCLKIKGAVASGAITVDPETFETQLETFLKSWLFNPEQ